MFSTELEFPNQKRFTRFGIDFGFVRGRSTVNYGWRESLYAVPYSFIAFPMTLLSAVLLLWTARPLTPRKEPKDA